MQMAPAAVLAAVPRNLIGPYWHSGDKLHAARVCWTWLGHAARMQLGSRPDTHQHLIMNIFYPPSTRVVPGTNWASTV